MASGNPTVRDLAGAMAVIDERTEQLLGSVEAMHRSTSEEFDKIWTTLAGIAGLDGVAVGLAEVAGVLAPLRALTPPTTSIALDRGVAEALAVIREAIGPERDDNFQSLQTAYDAAVGFIGEVPPEVPATERVDAA